MTKKRLKLQTHSAPARSSGRAGSVLIFAVVVLAILAMLSTAFLIVVRHAVQAARSGINYAQPEATLEAGQIRSAAALNSATRRYITATPEGVVGYNNNGFSMTTDASAMQLISPEYTNGQLVGQVGDLSHGSTDYLSTLKFFEHDPAFELAQPAPIQHPSFAVLSSAFPHYMHPATPVTNEIINTPFYTSAPLRITAQVQGDADRATPYFVRSALTEFINPDVASSGDPNATNLQRYRISAPAVGAVRGRHFIWVRDLDACFYAVPASWGLRDPSSPANTSWAGSKEQTIATAILEYLRETPKSQMMAPPPGVDVWTQQDMQNIASLAPKNYVHVSEVAETLQTLNPTLTQNYQFWRADLEAYFTTNLDIITNPDGTFTSTFKPAPAAININTAPEEVLQAMFSQVPYSDSETFATHLVSTVPVQYYVNGVAPCYAELLAKRIIAKRPFLSKIDFEDFVASLLPGNPNETIGISGPTTPVSAIKFAINKRNTATGKPEISLAQFMEMPGLPDNDYADGTVNPYKGSNTFTNMLARYNFFLQDNAVDGTSIALGMRDHCLLTVKAFNNLLNSVSAAPLPFKQVIAPSQISTANALEITGSPDLPFSSIVLGGDDQYIKDASNKIIGINVGANGVAETQITGFSYYSHDYSPQEYKPIRFKIQNPILDETFCLQPKNVGKFVYGLMPTLAPTNTGVPYANYSMSDLAYWSCIGEGTLSGYYDMWFNFGDKMELELGDKSPASPAKPNDPALTTTSGALLSNVKSTLHTDFPVIPFSVPIPAGAPLLVIPDASGILVTAPGGISPTTDPDDRIVQAIRLALSPTNRSSVLNVGPTADIQFTDLRPAPDGHIYIYPSQTNNYVLQSILGRPKDPSDFDMLVNVIVDGGDNVCQTNVLPDDLITGNGTTVGTTLTNEGYVWGPIRASQRAIDQELSSAADQKPTAAISLNAFCKGDVAWSPPICFRSRYFGTYVLAQGMITQPIVGSVSAGAAVNTVNFNPIETDAGKLAGIKAAVVPGAFFAISSAPVAGVPAVQHVYTIESVLGSTLTLSTPLVATVNATDYAAVYTSKTIGDRRSESIYDAYNDEVLWTRSPLTDKRTLGDLAP